VLLPGIECHDYDANFDASLETPEKV